jgi:hypothetical protein
MLSGAASARRGETSVMALTLRERMYLRHPTQNLNNNQDRPGPLPQPGKWACRGHQIVSRWPQLPPEQLQANWRWALSRRNDGPQRLLLL